MLENSPRRGSRWHVLTGALAVLAVGALTATPARAHFILKTPASWMSQDSLGTPQKAPPCGNEGGGTATSLVTGFHPGETVTITIDETIFHPGHYRVALAVNDRSELPAEPIVTPGSSPCGSAPIQNPPVFPVLADGLLVHTAAFSGPQTFQVTLPTNVTCTKCTLQIIEFMSDHPLNMPGGCFYHHCADVSIQAGADPDGSAGNGNGDAAVSTGDDASSSGGGDDASSGGDDASSGGVDASSGGNGNAASTDMSSGCSMGGGGSTAFAALAGLFAIAGIVRRRRR